MKIYVIGYDLNKRGQDYASLGDAIKNLGNWWHCLDSTWIVKTSYSAVEIRDHLSKHIDSNDELLVLKLNGEGAWYGFGQQCSDWLKNQLSSLSLSV